MKKLFKFIASIFTSIFFRKKNTEQVLPLKQPTQEERDSLHKNKAPTIHVPIQEKKKPRVVSGIPLTKNEIRERAIAMGISCSYSGKNKTFYLRSLLDKTMCPHLQDMAKLILSQSYFEVGIIYT